MTTKQVTKETKVCDVCGSDNNSVLEVIECKRCVVAVWTHCLLCGRDYCFDCAKDHVVDYKHGVHFSGGGDGTYCLSCDASLARSGTSKLHTAYLKIKQLRAEEAGWYRDFKERTDIAEKRVKDLFSHE
jgi:hypothetical protein